MDRFKDIRAIAFDADDTLWALQNYFEDVEHEYCELLAEYGKEKDISNILLIFYNKFVVFFKIFNFIIHNFIIDSRKS